MRFFILFIFFTYLLFSAKIDFNKVQENDSVAVIFKAGTLGLGFDFEYIHNSFLGIRANFNGLAYKDEGILEENNYNYLVDLQSAGVLVDYHPWQNAFRFSFGLYDNLTKVTGNVKPTSGKIIVGDHAYEPRQIGNITTNIDFLKQNPYIGLGFSSTEVNGFHFTLDMGVLYIGTPKATLKATAAKGYEGLQDILDKEAKIEENKINADIAKYKFFPVLSVGVQYKF